MHLKLVIQYDGTDFAGSQLQPAGRGRTVQGELETALGKLAGEPIRAALAGRTDSGVHAWGQVASLEFPARRRLSGPADVMRALNALLPSDLSVAHAEEAAEGFHARFSARQRAYRYLFWSSPAPNPLVARYSLHVRRTLDWDAMAWAASTLEGTHDFAAFAGQGLGVRDDEAETGEADRPSTVRTLSLVRLSRLPDEALPWRWGADEEGRAGALRALDLVGNAFLPQMVRTIVGTLLEVGQGKRTVDDIAELLASRDRRDAGATARPHGLCLMWVGY